MESLRSLTTVAKPGVALLRRCNVEFPGLNNSGCRTVRRFLNLQARNFVFRAGALVPAFALASVVTAAPGFDTARAETMSGALVRAYGTNPDLNQERAGVRAKDEDIPRTTSAYRPTVSATGQYGHNYLSAQEPGRCWGAPAVWVSSREYTEPGTLGLIVTETIFNGNRNYNSVRQAETNVLGARETLRNTEQNVLENGATAYMDVLRDTAILDLRKNNIIVLEEQLRQTRDRFQCRRGDAH